MCIESPHAYTMYTLYIYRSTHRDYHTRTISRPQRQKHIYITYTTTDEERKNEEKKGRSEQKREEYHRETR